MTDLIRRIDAIHACQVGPSDEWSTSTKDGYIFAATECSMNILRIPRTIDPAQIRAEALREAAASVRAGDTVLVIQRRILDLIDAPAPDHSAGGGNMIDKGAG